MKCECKLCGEKFEDDEFNVTNSLGEIIISCPNGCILEITSICDLPDVKRD